jgi:hypothetical protein
MTVIARTQIDHIQNPPTPNKTPITSIEIPPVRMAIGSLTTTSSTTTTDSSIPTPDLDISTINESTFITSTIKATATYRNIGEPTTASVPARTTYTSYSHTSADGGSSSSSDSDSSYHVIPIPVGAIIAIIVGVVIALAACCRKLAHLDCSSR